MRVRNGEKEVNETGTRTHLLDTNTIANHHYAPIKK